MIQLINHMIIESTWTFFFENILVNKEYINSIKKYQNFFKCHFAVCSSLSFKNFRGFPLLLPGSSVLCLFGRSVFYGLLAISGFTYSLLLAYCLPSSLLYPPPLHTCIRFALHLSRCWLPGPKEKRSEIGQNNLLVKLLLFRGGC